MSQRQPPGPLVIAFVGGLMGAIAALIITAIVRDIPTMDALRDPLLGDSKPLALGFLVGFFTVGAMVRNRLAMLMLGGLGKALLLALGMAGGAGLGGLVYAFTVMELEGGLGPAISHTLSIAGVPGSPAGPFIFGGALAALVGMLYAAGRTAVKTGARVVA